VQSGEAGRGRAVTIGATLPTTGALSAFGTSLELGYRQAIEELSDRVGLDARLLVLDNRSEPGLASQQARDLIVVEGAVALLGGATPPLSIPISVVAEQLEVPVILTVTPIRAWLGATDRGWTWAWDIFFDELQMTRTQFLASDLVDTNRRVALFTDFEEDGVVMGALWEETASDFGYEIVYHAEFPVGIGVFAEQVAEARAADADVVIAQVMAPDGRALLEAMRDGGYSPKLVFLEKAGNTGAWPRITGGLGEGTLAANWFAEGIGTLREAEFVDRYRERFGGVDSNLGEVVLGYTAAAALLDAIERAGSTEPSAINASIGATSGEYPAGWVEFDAAHASAQPAVVTQWQGTDMVLVMHADGSPGPCEIRLSTLGGAFA
jgi:branched-chain amino acid transport system substrate-binding protein